MIITLDLLLRFADKVIFGGSDDCWLWKGAIKNNGYGNFYVEGKTLEAHQVSFILTFGDQPLNHVRHTCDNRRCVNPHHLINGTR